MEPLNHSHFAAGLAKTGRRPSTLIWDASHLTGRTTRSSVGNSAARHDVITKPLRQYSDTEELSPNGSRTTHHAWLLAQAQWLSIDTRAKSSSPMISIAAHSKSVMGVTFSPCQADMLLSYSEDGIVKVWDMRTLGTGGPVASIDAFGACIQSGGSSVGGANGGGGFSTSDGVFHFKESGLNGQNISDMRNSVGMTISKNMGRDDINGRKAQRKGKSKNGVVSSHHPQSQNLLNCLQRFQAATLLRPRSQPL